MMKVCRVCKKSKALEFYSANAGKSDGLSNLCKPCDQAKGRAWYERNKKRRKETQKAWQLKNADKLAACSKSYRERNPEKVAETKAKLVDWQRQYHSEWYAQNAETKREKNRQWSKKNPSAHAAICANRRAALMRRTPQWARHEEILRVYQDARRVTDETGVPHEVDHIIPLRGKYVSGLHVETNLRVIPMVENRSKHAKFNTFTITGPAA